MRVLFRSDVRAAAIEAYAAPIFHARRFILVRSELDRDVLRALEHLQAALDAHGVECAIHRVRPGADDERTLIELVISNAVGGRRMRLAIDATREATRCQARSEEHTSELQSLMRISYDVFCLKKKTNTENHHN